MDLGSSEEGSGGEVVRAWARRASILQAAKPSQKWSDCQQSGSWSRGSTKARQDAVAELILVAMGWEFAEQQKWWLGPEAASCWLNGRPGLA